VIFALNLGIGIAGWWTGHRVAWVLYAIISIAGMVLIGAATPISGFWILECLS